MPARSLFSTFSFDLLVFQSSIATASSYFSLFAHYVKERCLKILPSGLVIG